MNQKVADLIINLICVILVLAALYWARHSDQKSDCIAQAQRVHLAELEWLAASDLGAETVQYRLKVSVNTYNNSVEACK